VRFLGRKGAFAVDQRDIEELRKRIARLEAGNSQRRIVYNQVQAAARLNMSVSKFRGEQNAGRINGKRRGRIWTFTDADLEAYLAAPDGSVT
jgi:hypothetical protein